MNIEKIPPPKFESKFESKKIHLSTKIVPIDKIDEKRSKLPTLPTMSPDERERFEKALEEAKKIGEGRRRFWNMLVTEVSKTDYQPPQNRQTLILDVGCGRCEEGIVLSAYFGGGEYGFPSENVKLIGIDIKKEDIEKAIFSHQRPDFSEQVTKYVLPPNFEFIHGDATKLDQYPQIPDQVDVIVIRHQQISANEKVWMEIFQKSLEKLSPNGIMILTSFSDIEHKMLMEKLKELDVEVVVNERNPFAKPTKHKEVSIDRNIAIVKRKK